MAVLTNDIDNGIALELEARESSASIRLSFGIFFSH